MAIKERRTGGRPLARLVPGLTRQAFAERGFHEAAILADWPAIVGTELAGKCAAIELGRDGALVVRADGPTAMALQHMEPQILDRIATYFGFHAVKRLTLRQGPVVSRQQIKRTAQVDCPPPTASLELALDDVPDDGLRDALLRLGSRVGAAEDDV